MSRLKISRQLIQRAILTSTLISTSVVADNFNSIDLVTRSASKQCLDWCITGVCFWLTCTAFPPSCSVVTTPKISHNLPDLLASVYEQPGDTGWTEMRATLGTATKGTLTAFLRSLAGIEPGGGGYLQASSSTENSNQRFKEVLVAGNPAAQAGNLGVPFLCKSSSTPLLPYFVSEADALAWRTGLPDSLSAAALVPGNREINQGRSFSITDMVATGKNGAVPWESWGTVYPRAGFINQAHDGKAAAVIAQRAIDIVTQPNQPHVYVPYGYKGYRELKFGDTRARSRRACENSGGLWQIDDDGNFSGIGQPSNQSDDGNFSGISNNFNNSDDSNFSGVTGGGYGNGHCVEQTSVQWMPPGNEATDKWQMISPNKSSSCSAFGAPGEWQHGRETQDGKYAWNYWRPYQCCMPGPGIFLYSIDTPKFCP